MQIVPADHAQLRTVGLKSNAHARRLLAAAPTEQTAVVTPTNDPTPNVVIKTSEAGTISVGGTAGCGLSSSAAVSSGVNTVTLSASDGDKEYRCTINFFAAGMHITHHASAHTRAHARTHARTLQKCIVEQPNIQG